ncbi:hypothetical protein DRQ25_07870 [Candidatus Fermentibacteria bacterium]|nr:MAG: hypothetical protein DRQ25_07870 [Candidatus Fermentibacteria bacterium]
MAKITQVKETYDSEKEEVKLSCTLFPARKGLRLQIKLVNLMLPLLGAAGSLKSKDSEDNPENNELLTQLMRNPDIIKNIVNALLNALDEKKTVELILELLNMTRFNGKELNKEPIFDVCFQGEYKLLFECLYFVVEANFKSFFGGGGIGSLLEKYLPVKGEEREASQINSKES